jgi:hypothetical protein
LLAGAAVIILGIGLSVILYLANAHKREQAGNLGEPGYTAGTLPTAEAGAPPLAKETPPENSTAVNDAFYRKKAVGNWLVRKQRDNGIDMEMLWAYSANGLLNCTGTITGQRQKYYIVMSGIWEIKDGHLNIKIDVSNIPEFVAPGDTSSYRIITLTDSEWTYVVTEDGKTETANRIR